MPDWLTDLHRSHGVAHAIAVLSFVALTGMALGSLKVRGVGLGVAAVLFSGIFVGHLGEAIEPKVLEFTKDFGLILFIFTIGLQLGPGFLSTLRRQGLTLNLLALAIVLIGSGIAVALPLLLGFDRSLVPGLLAGAVTNTPSLAAGQQALSSLPGISEDRVALPAMAYAVAYPVGAFGIIGSMLLLKAFFRIDVRKEASDIVAARRPATAALERRTFRVTNPALDGARIGDIPSLGESGVIVSRLRLAGTEQVAVAIRSAQLHLGDKILAVGTRAALDSFEKVIGPGIDEDLLDAPGSITYRRVVLTNRNALGRTVPELALEQSFGVVVTRVTRSDLQMTAVPGLRLQFGDVLQMVGPADCIEQAATYLGNSVRALNETHFVPLFAGILAGVLLGSVPIAIPGLPTPLRLGLAGGPLIVAMIVGRIGHLGPLVWHMPANANLAFRELGIALFLASVGLAAGPRFVEAALSRTGLLWLLAAACIAWVPLLMVGIVARAWLKLDFAALSGLLSGATTDPPALAFANGLVGSDAPNVAYATVYPLTMILRIVVMQVIVLTLCG